MIKLVESMGLIDILDIWIDIIMMLISLVQVIFVVAAFCVARSFLEQHRAKLQVENQEKYAIQIIEQLDELGEILRKILMEDAQDQKEFEDIQENKWGIPADYLLPVLKLYWIKDRFKSCDKDIFIITSKITNLGIFLNDPEISILFREVMNQFLEIIKQFSSALKKQSELIQVSKEGYSQDFPKTELGKIYNSLPKSIYDSDNTLVKVYNQNHLRLVTKISNYIN